MRPLTARQSRFVSAYVAGASAAEAARQAGYGPGYSAKAAKYLLHHPSIAAAIQEMHMELQKKTLFDAEQAYAKLEELIAFARSKGNAMACMKGAEIQCRLAGLLVDKLEVKTAVDLGAALQEAKQRVARVVNAPALTSDSPLD